MKHIIILILLLTHYTLLFASDDITICTDLNFWYPFSFEENNISKGLHIDIVTYALQSIKLNPVFKPLPWKRCLIAAQHGEFDAVVAASYKPDRAELFYYPTNAAIDNKSHYRITQVEYIIVSFKDDPYEFNGNIKTLPNPIRVPAGYSLIDDLKKEGLSVETSKGDINNLKKLARDKSGVVITLEEIVRMLIKKEPHLLNQLKVHHNPFKSKSYYMIFSKAGKITPNMRHTIWKKIAEIRDDDTIMEKLLKNY